MKHILWTDEEVSVLKEKYQKLGVVGVLKLVNHSRASIKEKAKKLGLSFQRKVRDLSGQRFSRLLVLSIDHEVKYSKTTEKYWKCRCDCGNIKAISEQKLLNGDTRSCGCFRKKVTGDNSRTHGKSRIRIHRIWCGIKARCNDKKNNRYGGRGITVCPEWRDFLTFHAWAMANGYADQLTIDRIDNDGNYEPSNCRWADNKTQARNTSTNRMITYNGETKSVSDWADIYSLKASVIIRRLNRGWDVERTFNTPLCINQFG